MITIREEAIDKAIDAWLNSKGVPLKSFGEKQFLDFHKKSTAIGKLASGSGLCDTFKKDETFKLFIPTEEDCDALNKEVRSTYCWASGNSSCKFYEYTTLRETIVLFCAVIDGEI
jgi:hypothetical protein